MIHRLKILPVYFVEVFRGRKTFEFRFNDRNFMENDLVILQEIYPPDYKDKKLAVTYSGAEIKCRITYILRLDRFLDNSKYCIFSFRVISTPYTYIHK
jgi:hypothetical protein